MTTKSGYCEGLNRHEVGWPCRCERSLYLIRPLITGRRETDRQTDRQMNLRNATYNEAVEGGPDSSSW